MTRWRISPGLACGFAAVWRVVWPGLSLLLAVLAAAAPGGSGAFSIAALVPVMVIYYWVLAGPRGLPFALVFGVGLMLDAVSYGPFGAWALIYVAVALQAVTVAEFAQVGVVHRYFMLLACLGLASLLQLGLMLMFGTELPSPTAVSVGIFLAAAGYPVVAAMLRAGTAGRADTPLFERAVRP